MTGLAIMKYASLTLLLGACASGVPLSEPVPEQPQQAPQVIESAPECLDEAGDAVVCFDASECCDGFYCGYEPQSRSRQKVCLYAGR